MPGISGNERMEATRHLIYVLEIQSYLFSYLTQFAGRFEGMVFTNGIGEMDVKPSFMALTSGE